MQATRLSDRVRDLVERGLVQRLYRLSDGLVLRNEADILDQQFPAEPPIGGMAVEVPNAGHALEAVADADDLGGGDLRQRVRPGDLPDERDPRLGRSHGEPSDSTVVGVVPPDEAFQVAEEGGLQARPLGHEDANAIGEPVLHV